MLTALSPGPGSGVVSVRISGWDQVLTCRDKKDACAEDDVVPAAVELAGGHTEPAEEEQRDAEDGEDAGGPHSPCGEKERAVWSQPAWVPEGSWRVLGRACIRVAPRTGPPQGPGWLLCSRTLKLSHLALDLGF